MMISLRPPGGVGAILSIFRGEGQLEADDRSFPAWVVAIAGNGEREFTLHLKFPCHNLPRLKNKVCNRSITEYSVSMI